MNYLKGFLCLIAILMSSHAYAFDTEAKQAFMVDYDTGAVLFEKSADEKMPTSSMSKVMTMYAVFDALGEGRVSLDDTFKVSEKAWRKQGSKMFVEVGKQVKIADLIRGVIIQSGNDATIVLAEGLNGTEDAFARQLNSYARKLGMANSQFQNASGWPDENHYSTARDLAILAGAIIRDFPEYYALYSEKEFTYSGIKQNNRNPLLYSDLNVDGIKTGHTDAAGYGLMASGTKDGRRIVMVINGTESEAARKKQAYNLMQWGLNNFENKIIAQEGTEITSAPVKYGVADTVSLIASKRVALTVEKGEKFDLNPDIQTNAPIVAPVEKGQKLGEAVIRGPYDQEIRIDLLAANAVEEAGFFAKTYEQIKDLISGGA